MVTSISSLIEQIQGDISNTVPNMGGNTFRDTFLDVLNASLSALNPKYNFEGSFTPGVGKFTMADSDDKITNNYTDASVLLFNKEDLTGFDISHFEYVDEAIIYLYDYVGFKATFLIEDVTTTDSAVGFLISNKYVSKENEIAETFNDVQIDVKILNGSING